ncbi:DUF1269 domain-containing protein [Streptomyces spongiae]|nr:DUF1269 domain-containing protein [Streptomyces spongiae]
MTDMIAVAYPGQDVAELALAELRQLDSEHTVHVVDAVLVTRDDEGDVKLHGKLSPTASGAMDGALWGGIIGLLLLQPLLGAAIGAATGGVIGATSEDDDRTEFVKALGRRLTVGGAAVIAVIGDATPDKALPRIAKFGGDVLHTSLSEEDEDALRLALRTWQPTAQQHPADAAGQDADASPAVTS